MKFNKCHVWVLVRWELRKRLASPSISKFSCVHCTWNFKEQLSMTTHNSLAKVTEFRGLGYDRLILGLPCP